MEVTLLVVRVCPFVLSRTKCQPAPLSSLRDLNKNKAEENLENIEGDFSLLGLHW